MGRKASCTIGAAAATLAAVASLAIPSAASACENAATDPAELTPEQASDAVVCLMNQARRKAGVGKLRSDRRLERAARRHSAAMDDMNFFSHGGPGGSPLGRIQRTGYLSGAPNWGVGENLHWGAHGPGTPQTTVNRWLSSASHRATMLSGRYKQVGVGVARGAPIGGGWDDVSAIYTADFGYRK